MAVLSNPLAPVEGAQRSRAELDGIFADTGPYSDMAELDVEFSSG